MRARKTSRAFGVQFGIKQHMEEGQHSGALGRKSGRPHRYNSCKTTVISTPRMGERLGAKWREKKLQKIST